MAMATVKVMVTATVLVTAIVTALVTATAIVLVTAMAMIHFLPQKRVREADQSRPNPDGNRVNHCEPGELPKCQDGDWNGNIGGTALPSRCKAPVRPQHV